MQSGILILVSLFFASCNNVTEANTVKVNTDSSKPAHDTTIHKSIDGVNNATDTFHLQVVSGMYTYVSLAIDKDSNVTGAYEYNNAWDNKSKAYTQQCSFYFYGHYHTGDSSMSIMKCGWPRDEKQLTGRLRIFHRSGNLMIGIILNDIPDCYTAYDFSEMHGYESKLGAQKNWIQVRIVKSDKAKLYTTADSSTIKKAYLVKNNVVKVLEKSGDWYKVEYSAPFSSKSIFVWVREEDLYKVDW